MILNKVVLNRLFSRDYRNKLQLVNRFRQKHLLSFLLIFSLGYAHSQAVEGEWQFDKVFVEGENEVQYKSPNGTLSLQNGLFEYAIPVLDNQTYSGYYLHQNKLLVFYYDTPSDTTRPFKIKSLSDSMLVMQNGNMSYSLSPKIDETVIKAPDAEMVKSSGFTINSLFRGALGMFALLIISFLLSKNRKAINWRTVTFGLLAQLALAIGILKIDLIQNIFKWVGGLFIAILDFTEAGTKFLFASFTTGQIEGPLVTFAISILPTIIFFSAITSVLFYFGIIQKIVSGLAWLLTKFLKISGSESLSVAGNIFLGQTESPLMIKAYLEKMTKSEILLVMIGGMATVAGGVLAAYIGFLGGDDTSLQLYYAKHLLTASVMAAPGAIVISKMLYPQMEKINSDINITQDKIGSNVLDAIANGTSEGLKLAVNVGAMLLVFLAFIAMANGILGWVGDVTSLNDWVANHTVYTKLSLEFLLGYLFAPLMWLIGVAQEDMALMGQLLGIKLAASEFIGYIQLADLKDVANASHLQYEKSVIMATYMLCGFANFASIGIQIGGIGSLAPGQRKTLSEFGMRALIGGTIASLLSATIAGMIIG
ncbi:MAG: Na+ dependent nucleoside transporter [Saprospiraceae bacterium]|nr:Na+ dependent nucleoside transporter [Bacteroidia bacterium]NNE16540.1 Na+ dependent nucleoside transporter [Saprospiraceae bacterium]NNL90766.1 Na+ dependent nucleoside transporter [Saprospiraceae bacterium]